VTKEPAAPEQEPRAECPYCGCGFIPSEPGQVYCSPFCEQQEAIEKGRQTESG
jgi:hypothetical protein